MLALDGACETLAALVERGIRCALVCDTGLTPGSVVRRNLARLGLLDALDVQVFSDEVGFPKPDPRAFRAALTPLGIPPERALHVGDLRRTDVAGARALGMTSARIRACHDDDSELPDADRVVASHAELWQWLALGDLRARRGALAEARQERASISIKLDSCRVREVTLRQIPPVAGGVHRRADPRPRRARRRSGLPARGGAPVQAARHAVRGRRSADRPRPHRPHVGGRALGRRARHILMAKALSGGFVPVGAVGMRKEIFDKLFSSMIRAPIHGSTFSMNNLAMAAGIATLRVMKEENLVEHAAKLGEGLIADLRALVDKHEFLHEVRGKGLMIALEFGEPRSLTLRAAWKLLETAQPGLFSQMITIPLFQRHRILSQVAGHNSNVVKFLPPLVIGEEDRRAIRAACDEVIGDAHKVPGSIWDLGKTLAGHAIKARRAS